MPDARRFPDNVVERAVKERMTLDIPCELIQPNPGNPRKTFDPVDMLELQRDIGTSHQVVPAIVKPVSGAGRYQFRLVAGERRWRACTEAGRPLQCLVRRYRNLAEELLETVRENCSRRDLSPLEYAELIDRMEREVPQFRKITDSVARMDAIGRVFNRSGSWCSQYRVLQNASPEVRQRLDPSLSNNRRLPVILASRLSRTPQEQQRVILQRADAERLTHRQIHRLVDDYATSAGVAEHRKGRKPRDMRNFERVLRLAERQVQDLLEQAARDPRKFEKMFAYKSPAELRAYAAQAGELAQQWEKIKDLVLGVRIGLKASGKGNGTPADAAGASAS